MVIHLWRKPLIFTVDCYNFGGILWCLLEKWILERVARIGVQKVVV